MNKTILAIVVLVIILAIGFYLGFDNRQSVENRDIKLGGLFGITGYASFAGEASRDGFIMAIEDSGMNINYNIEDFQSDLKTVATAAKKLIEVDDSKVIIGPEWAEFGEIAVPIGEQAKALFISPWMVSEKEWAISPYYLSATPSERLRHRKMIDYMANQGIDKIVIVYSNNAWSIGNVEIFKDEVKRNGKVEMIGEFKFSQDETDYRTEILKLKALNPKAIYSVIATDESHGIFSQQLRELSVNLPVFIDNSRAESPVLKERFGRFVVGQIYPAPKDSKNKAQFDAKYQKRFGYTPGALSAATAYDMTTLVLRAVKDGAKTPDDVGKFLRTTKDYDGFSGVITFNERGQIASEEVVIKEITETGAIILE